MKIVPKSALSGGLRLSAIAVLWSCSYTASMKNKKPTRKNDYASRSGVQLIARIEKDLKNRLMAVAKANDRTITAELVRAIRSYLAQAES